MRERQRERQRARQKRFRQKREAEYRERLQILSEKRTQALRVERPDLYRAITSSAFKTAWHQLYDEPPPDLADAEPDVIEYRLEAMHDDWMHLHGREKFDIMLGKLGK